MVDVLLIEAETIHMTNVQGGLFPFFFLTESKQSRKAMPNHCTTTKIIKQKFSDYI